MPTVQQLPPAVAVNLTDEMMLDQGGNSVAATVAQVLALQPQAAGSSTGTLTVIGDVTGSGSNTIDLTLATVATPGTYDQVTIDAKGRVLAGSALTATVIDTALGYTPLAGNQTVTLSGDISGSGATAIAATLATVATPGTYEQVTIDAKGRVLAGSALTPSAIDTALGYTPLAGNQTVTLSGDISGSGATAITATLATVATPGTYDQVTIDAKGRVLAGNGIGSVDLVATGSTAARTLAVRAADRINVLDFGADSSGATDSAPAFAAAMAVVTGAWGLVWVPRGNYLLDSVVNQPSGHSIHVQFEDGANISGAGYLGVDRVSAQQGAFRLNQIGGGYFGFAPAVGAAANPGFVTDYITNDAQNSLSMRVGWDHRYTNTNTYGRAHTGTDIAHQRIHSWPNLFDNSSGWGLWEVVAGTTLDEDTAARAGLSASAELSESDVVNNGAEAGWTWHSGVANAVQGMAIDPWGQNGAFGGNILFAYGSTGSYDGGSGAGALNQRWFSYPAVFSADNPTVAAGTIIINGTSITVTGSETLASIAAAINAAAIVNVAARVSTWGGVVSRLVIYSTTAADLGTLTLAGTALASLGMVALTYTTPRGNTAAVVGNAAGAPVGAQFVVNGTTITVGGTGTAENVAQAIVGAGIAGIAADTNAAGNLIITCYMSQQPGGLVLVNVGAGTTLATLGLGAGIFLPPTPPKAFATAYSDQTSPVCLTTDAISISATDSAGTVHGPVTVTLSGGAGTGWPADVAASISAALTTAGWVSSNFTALSTGTAVVAVRAVGIGAQQGVQLRNTAGGTLTLADANGSPLETLGIAPGTYQPGGYSAGSQTVFMAAEDAIAPGGRGVFIGGVSNATDPTVFPHTPLETRGGFLHGLRLDRATFNDNNAIVLASTHGIAWGSTAGSQGVLGVSAGTLEFNGAPIVNSAAFDAAFGSEVGDLLVRSSAGWAAFTPGTQGQVLEAAGPGTMPQWISAIPPGSAGAVLIGSGTEGVAVAEPLSTVLDAAFGTIEGGILVRAASAWAALPGGTSGQVLTTAGAGALPVWATPTGGAGTVVRGAIAGFLLANDATTPASVLDIAPGQCADSLAATYITTTATFYASTTASWAPGGGSASAPVGKMAPGLTVAANTWYHVFAIQTSAGGDFYFTTSAVGNNAPTAATAERRIGSFLTNATAQIIAFTQANTAAGAYMFWAAQMQDYAGAISTSQRQLVTLSVPTGVAVRPLGRWVFAAAAYWGIVTSPAETDVAPGTSWNVAPGFDVNEDNALDIGGQYVTNTAAQLGFRGSAFDNSGIYTRGWIDERGMGA